mgnify:CR=1 FL=1
MLIIIPTKSDTGYEYIESENEKRSLAEWEYFYSVWIKYRFSNKGGEES